MSNVIHLKAPAQPVQPQARMSAIITCFARHRRFGDDVFWLKENAELLNILECTGAQLAPDALEAHHDFYANAERRLGFFPQYYRFLLSICLDLEDLGLPGTKAEALAHWAAAEGLADAELSDLQRAEAVRLMQRRGVHPLADDAGLSDRLHGFIDRPETFAMPNKKAAYELTHIVFYLSEYGRKDPGLSAAATKSLEFAGLLAYLDQNSDLLAEICVALRYAGCAPPPLWETWLQSETLGFAIAHGPELPVQDDYHNYFVCNWLMAATGRDAFASGICAGRMNFTLCHRRPGPLRVMSESLFELNDKRSDDWASMRPHVLATLPEAGHDILLQAERSTDNFEAFFAGFARTGLRGVSL